MVSGNGDSDLGSVLPAGATYTFYGCKQEDFHGMPLEKLDRKVVDGTLPIQVGKVFHIDEIVEAHRVRGRNTAGGKIVVLT